jgi:hypothetical protein
LVLARLSGTRLQSLANQTILSIQENPKMNSLVGLTLERVLCESAIGGVETMPSADPWTQYGPAGILLAAFSGAIAILFRWASPLVAEWIKSRIALTDSVRKTHEETAAANSIRFEQILTTFAQIQAHFEHSDKRIDKIYRVIRSNCGRGEEDSDEEITETAK